MSIALALEIAKIVGTIAIAGTVGYQSTGTWQGALAAIATGMGGLFVPTPKKPE